MGPGVVQIVQQFFITGILPSSLQDIIMVLIPKKTPPTSVHDLRPIALYNVLYKILSKVVANRLKIVLSSTISKTQSAFLQGRLITDNILVSYNSCIF